MDTSWCIIPLCIQLPIYICMLKQVLDVAARLADAAGVPPGAVLAVRVPYRICPLGAHVDHQASGVNTILIVAVSSLFCVYIFASTFHA